MCCGMCSSFYLRMFKKKMLGTEKTYNHLRFTSRQICKFKISLNTRKCLNYEKTLVFNARVVKHRTQLPREAVESLPLETFKTRLLQLTLFWAGGGLDILQRGLPACAILWWIKPASGFVFSTLGSPKHVRNYLQFLISSEKNPCNEIISAIRSKEHEINLFVCYTLLDNQRPKDAKGKQWECAVQPGQGKNTVSASFSSSS